jgi:serine/threonine protein kinase
VSGICNPRNSGIESFPQHSLSPLFAAVLLLSQMVDVWAAGVTLYMMLMGRVPFWGDTVPDIYSAIQVGVGVWGCAGCTPVVRASLPAGRPLLAKPCLLGFPSVARRRPLLDSAGCGCVFVSWHVVLFCWCVCCLVLCCVAGQRDEVAFPPDFNPVAADLLRRLMVKEPGTRITLEEVKVHPFLTGGTGFVPFSTHALQLVEPTAEDCEAAITRLTKVFGK